MYESTDKMVSHPSHYQSKSGLEVIDVIAAFTEGLDGIEAVDTGNAIKYICRWKDKNGVQDLEKAMWYIQHLIDHLIKEDEEKRVELTLEKYREYMYGNEEV
jgi:mevalonate pyrophosphate decarboxylase